MYIYVVGDTSTVAALLKNLTLKRLILYIHVYINVYCTTVYIYMYIYTILHVQVHVNVNVSYIYALGRIGRKGNVTWWARRCKLMTFQESKKGTEGWR